MLEKLSMSVRSALITIAGGKPAHGELPRWLGDIAKKVGISYRTARSLWNDEISNPDHLAARAVRDAAEAILAEKEREQHAAQYDTLVARLASSDEDFHREDISAILHAAHLLRQMART